MVYAPLAAIYFSFPNSLQVSPFYANRNRQPLHSARHLYHISTAPIPASKLNIVIENKLVY